MSLFWKNNKNVILVAVAMFVASITGLLFFLSDEKFNHEEYKADVLGAISTESDEPAEINYNELPELKEGPAVIIGMDGLVDFANKEYEEQSLYENEEMVDELFFSYVHPDDLANMLSKYGQVIASEEPETIVGPYRLKNAEGEYELYMASLMPVEVDNKMLGVAVSTLSISESVKNEEYIEEEPEEEVQYTEKKYNVTKKAPEKTKEEDQKEPPADEVSNTFVSKKKKETPPESEPAKKTIKKIVDDVKKDIPPPKTDPVADKNNIKESDTLEGSGNRSDSESEPEKEKSSPAKNTDSKSKKTKRDNTKIAPSKTSVSETPKKETPKSETPKKKSPKKDTPKNEKKYKLF